MCHESKLDVVFSNGMFCILLCANVVRVLLVLVLVPYIMLCVSRYTYLIGHCKSTDVLVLLSPILQNVLALSMLGSCLHGIYSNHGGEINKETKKLSQKMSSVIQIFM